MSESKIKNNLQNWNKLLEVLNTEVVNKNDFIDYFEKVIKLAMEIKKRQEEAVSQLEQTYLILLDRIKKDYDFNFNKLKNYLENQDNKMYQEHEKMMEKIDIRLGELKNGEDADEQKIIREVLSKIEIPKIEEIEKDLPKLGTAIRDGLELLQNEERLDIKAVNGLNKKFDELNEKINHISSGGIGGMKKITFQRYYNLSDQVNGITRTFTLPRKTLGVIAIFSTQAPVNFNKGVDWTYAGNTLTLTAQVTIPAAGQTLWALIEMPFFYKA